ncbi:MAG: hypothetical protein ACOZIN_05690, partial [Myxococcota bacterium]
SVVLALAIAVSLTAQPGLRLRYEQKCYHCHSEEVAERPRLTETQWRVLIEQMRQRAPLLISRSDVTVLARFMARTLKLVPARPPVRSPPEPSRPLVELPPLPAVVPPVEPSPAPEPPPEVEVEPEPKEAEPQLDEAAVALETEGSALMRQRCSKCHSLGRVYGKLDNLPLSLAIVDRMRFKTGSGITEAEAEVLKRYLRAQFQ